MWVYTEYGEKYAELHGHKGRKAGTQAMIGYKPVDGLLATAWEKKGYIRWEEDHIETSEKGEDL